MSSCIYASERLPLSLSSGLLHSSPDSLAESWFRAKLSRQRSYSSAYSYEESDLDLSRSMGIHALIDNMVSFISGDVGLAPAFKEPEESMSTSPQATILAMEQQQSRAEVRDRKQNTFIDIMKKLYQTDEKYSLHRADRKSETEKPSRIRAIFKIKHPVQTAKRETI